MPRLRVAAALRQQAGHLTAEAIYSLVAASNRQTPIALSTVYRTLEAFEEARLVSAIHADSRATYEWIDPAEAHCHLTCTRCGAELSLDAEVLTRFEQQIEHATDFEVHFDHLAMRGLCAGCRGHDRKPAGGQRAAEEP
jgi:Fur family ferric uptake transcriptional regulator